MNFLIPIVIGSTVFLYIHSFNYLKKKYEEKNRHLQLKDLLHVGQVGYVRGISDIMSRVTDSSFVSKLR